MPRISETRPCPRCREIVTGNVSYKSRQVRGSNMTLLVDFLEPTLAQGLGHYARGQHSTTTDDVSLGIDEVLVAGLEVDDDGAFHGATFVRAVILDVQCVQLRLWQDSEQLAGVGPVLMVWVGQLVAEDAGRTGPVDVSLVPPELAGQRHGLDVTAGHLGGEGVL